MNGCNHELMYHPVWDCMFCPECDEWLESSCPDPLCEYCIDRPEKPSLSPTKGVKQ